MAQPTNEEINDQVAQDALRYGRKSRKVPTHSAMQRTEEEDPDADATDAAEDDDGWDDNGN